MTIVVLCICLVQAVQQQSGSAADSLRVFGEESDSAALAAAVRQRPDDARLALSRLLSLAAARSPERTRDAYLASAGRLSRVYAQVWRDSFPMRQVESFAQWSPERRAAKVLVDSLRREGVRASHQEGISRAQRLWRASLHRAAVLSDTAGEAAALGNIGAGFYLTRQFDSAAVYLARSRRLALAARDLRTAANALGILASVSKDRGELVDARQLYSQSSALRERIGDVGGLAADQNNIGLIAQSLGDLAAARRAYASALAANREYGRTASAATNVTNLANVASLTADYVSAGALYEEALAIYRSRGDRVDAAFVLRNLGLLEMRRGDYPRAEALLREALAIYDTTGPSDDAVDARRQLALVITATGNLQGAMSELRQAERRAAATRVATPVLAGLVLTHADLSVQLNTLAEADGLYARAARLYAEANDETGQLAAREGRGVLLLLRQDFDAALAEFQAIARAHLNVGDKRAAAATTLLIGYAQEQRGDFAGARRTLAHDIATFHASGDVVAEAMAIASLGDAELASGQSSTAERVFRDGLARLGTRVAPDVGSRLHAGLGDVLLGRGAVADAVRELRIAIADIEETSQGLRLEERRSAFLEDKWPVYARLALAERARGNDGEAFAVSERLRARQMLSLMARGRVASVEPDDSRRVREQDLRRRIGELTQALLGGVNADTLRGAGVAAGQLDAMREALDSAQRSYSALLLEMKERSPDYARLVTTETVAWRDAAARLTPDEVLIEYLVADSTTLAFVVTDGGIASVDLHASRHELATLVEFARANLARPQDATSRALWRAPLRRLYQELLAPLEPHLQGKHTLIIVPHAELHYLPFATLVIPAASMGARTPEQFLVERYVLSYAPSASVWISHGARRGRAGGRVLALAPRESALPASHDEVEAIGRLYGSRATVLTGAAATERAFRQAAADAEIIHLATSGVLNKRNPLFSFVELAPGDGDDGRLEVREALGLSLHARLLVLSACQTAISSGTLGDVPSGEDWVGLMQAFLIAGASNVMGTLWPIDDRATSRLMTDFYTALSAGRTDGQALADAQRAALGRDSSAHPFQWAGFALFERRDREP
jgi:CHAT domain-containing protein